jgi:hypothetical protein
MGSVLELDKNRRNLLDTQTGDCLVHIRCCVQALITPHHGGLSALVFCPTKLTQEAC